MPSVTFGGEKYRLSVFDTPKPKTLVGKCPRCRKVFTMAYQDQIDQYGHHIYRCTSCGSLVGAPTDWAICSKYGLLSKDCFWSPCAKCPHRKSVPGHGVCIHFEGPTNYAEVS